MLTTLIASSKVGCGKSTLVSQPAAHWAQAGQRAVTVDADRQGSSFRWASLKPDNVPGVLALQGRPKALQKLPPDTQQLLIDTPAGSGERELEASLDLADVLLTAPGACRALVVESRIRPCGGQISDVCESIVVLWPKNRPVVERSGGFANQPAKV